MAIIGTNYRFETNGVLTQGGTVPPTAGQAFYCNQLVVVLTAGDADTTCSITHNWNLSQAQQLIPLPNIAMWLDVSTLGTINPVLAFSIATNVITVVKASVVGSNFTGNVVINRPLNVIQ